jgi:hypothetical protein
MSLSNQHWAVIQTAHPKEEDKRFHLTLLLRSAAEAQLAKTLDEEGYT